MQTSSIGGSGSATGSGRKSIPNLSFLDDGLIENIALQCSMLRIGIIVVAILCLRCVGVVNELVLVLIDSTWLESHSGYGCVINQPVRSIDTSATMGYWLNPRTWIEKMIGLATYFGCLLIFPVAVVISWVYNFIRSGPFTPPRVVSNKVVVITGASSGIGQYLALEYAKKGAKLVLAARRKEKLEQVKQMCLENGAADAAICPTDVGNPEACKNLVKFTLDTFGAVDVLVNNAGTAVVAAVEDYTDTESFRKTVDVDFWGNVLTTKFALEHLRRARGQVVVTCSVGAFVPYPKQAFYNASKAALLSFYDTLRVEPVGHDVAITIALPGFIKSELTTKGPKGHIPRWWPMMDTAECAKEIVDAALKNRRYALVPFWYSFNLVFRLFAPDLLEIPPRMFLLGKPPSKGVKQLCETLLGEETTKKAFQSLKALAE